MNEQRILLGSLSQDLFRIANFIQTGSTKSALRFWQETHRWTVELKKEINPHFLDRLLTSLSQINFDPTSLEQGEKILTYGVITQSLAVYGY